MTHPAEDVGRVQALAAQGFSASEIARVTGINRSTLRAWIGLTPVPPSRRWIFCSRCNPDAELDEAAYVYLLGLYLGDGCISAQAKSVWRLRIFQTSNYVLHIEECAIAMHAVLPNNVAIQPQPGCVEIGSSSKHWPCLFPQHGPGRKHDRPIVLETWQQQLTNAYPKLLLRGLVQSDGCRDRNFAMKDGRRYDYPRYSFKNRSADILRIFTDACDRLGVHWTAPAATTISIARRADVAFLDASSGPNAEGRRITITSWPAHDVVRSAVSPWSPRWSPA